MQNCNNNQLIRLPDGFNYCSSLLLKFQNKNDIDNVIDFTIFIGDDIIWNSNLKNSIIIPEFKILLPIGWLIKKYKSEHNNMSILLKSDHNMSYQIEFT
jgi:hypothetical protein